MAVWKAAVGRTLPCQGEGDNMHDLCLGYSVTIVEDNDTPIDNDPPHSMNIYTVKNFTNCPKTAKFTTVFTSEKYSLYSTL